MCGIAGFVGTSGAAQNPLAVLQKMADAIAHRGPDDEGFFSQRLSTGIGVGLAHRRLSIIDLASGHQPMTNETGRIQIVFNGEIYNYPGLRDELQALGYPVEWHEYPMEHSVCIEEVRALQAFLRRVLAA